MTMPARSWTVTVKHLIGYYGRRFLQLVVFMGGYLWFDLMVCIRRPGGRDDGSIVVVRLDALGDLFLWLNSGGIEFLTSLSSSRPRAKAYLLVQDRWASTAHQVLGPESNWEVVGIDRFNFAANPLYRARILKRFSRGVSITINPTISRDTLWADSIVRATQAPVRLGIRGDLVRMTPIERFVTSRWYTDLFQVRVHQERSDLEAKNQAEFLDFCQRSLDLQANLSEASRGLAPPYAFEGESSARNALGKALVFPCAGKAYREWPKWNFAQVIEYVAASGLAVKLVSAPTDRKALLRLQELTNARTEIVTGPLRDLPKLISDARIVIGNESGPIQIARFAKTPVVTIVGGGQFGRFLPRNSGKDLRISNVELDCYECDWLCSRKAENGTVPCIGRISVDSVISDIRRVLRREP